MRDIKPFLVLIGDGPDLVSMQQLAVSLGLDGVTKFVGRLALGFSMAARRFSTNCPRIRVGAR